MASLPGSPSALLRLVDELLAVLSPAQSETLRLGAIPHRLDLGLIHALFGEAASARLVELRRFHFIDEDSAGQLTYHRQVREHLLTLWQRDAPDQFRQVSATLAGEFSTRLSLPGVRAETILPEWLYHLLAVDAPNGMARLAPLFERAVESHELGFAQRLSGYAREQMAWLADQSAWLEYFSASLDLAQFEPKAAGELATLAQAHPDTALGASAERALGMAYADGRQWAKGQKALRQARNAFAQMGQMGNVARTDLALGDLYRHLADSSGGIVEESHPFASTLHRALYFATGGPFLLYRWLAERVDWLPNLHGANFQNWIVLRLLRMARQHYQAAYHAYLKLPDERGVIETQDRLGTMYLRLGYLQKAERLFRAALDEPVVRASPYRMARARMRLGQTLLAGGRGRAAAADLSASREVLAGYRDWPLVAEAALSLGHAAEATLDWHAAVGAYALGLEATRHSQDALQQTELARRLRRLVARLEVVDQQAAQAGQSALRAVATTAFIDRFPGAVHRTFQGLAALLALPFGIITALTLVVAMGISMTILEGEILLKLPPVSFFDKFQLLVGVLLPLISIWGYQLAYRVLGLGIVQFLLPLARVEESQPDVFVLSSDGLSHLRPDSSQVSLPWADVVTIIADDRSLFQTPLALFSRMILVGRETRIFVPATTHDYRDLRRQVELGLQAAGHEPYWIKAGLSILRSAWFWVAVGLALGLALAVMFAPLLFHGSIVHNCYEAVGAAVADDCSQPSNNWLYGTAYTQIATGLFLLIFPAGTAVRWWRANRSVAWALAAGDKSD